MTNKVVKDDPQYEVLLQNYQREEGTTFEYAGVTWMAVQDNAELYFVKQTGSGIDNSYGSSSVPR